MISSPHSILPGMECPSSTDEEHYSMKTDDIIQSGFAMPLHSPAYHRGPYRFINREYLVITYRTDPEKLRALVPEPLQIDETSPLVHFEFIRMPDSAGFGDYTEAGQVIPVTLNGRKGNYIHAMYLDSHAPVAAGREIWGFPKKWGAPGLKKDSDALLGTLSYGSMQVACGSMGFKYQESAHDEALRILGTPNFLLKIIPHVDGSARVMELVEYRCENIRVHGAWSGPAALQLWSHALAPVADLPVLEVVSARHMLADLDLGAGQVVHDYLSQGPATAAKEKRV